MSRLSLLFMLLGALQSWCLAQDIESLEQDALYEAARRAAPSVVRIETIGGLDRIGEQLISSAPVSGVIVDPAGYIVSSAFNFKNQPSSILVELADGTRKTAKIVSRNHSRQLVLLKVDVETPMPMPRVATKSSLRVGQWAITVGRTLPGDEINMTVGIVSAKERIWGRAVQTDANVSPANYGGALVDVTGAIVGVLVPLSPTSSEVLAGAEWYDSGIGFAVPMEDILASLARWKEGDLHRGLLGIALQGSDEYGTEPVVALSRPKSPARDAGIVADDKILRLNGKRVRRQVELRHVLGPLYAGDHVTVTYQRGDETFEKDIELTDKLEPYEHAFLGILPSRELEPKNGVEVRYVYPASPADECGLQLGDSIIKLAGHAVSDASGLRTALAALEPETEIQLTFRRAEQEQTVDVRLNRLPETFPTALPAPYPDVPPPNENLPALGRINIKLPEEAGDCLAYVPQSYDPRFAHSLLVVLPVPGQQTAEEAIQAWRDVSEAQRVLLLAPEPQSKRGWRPDEVTFVRKTIDNLKGSYRIDAERILVHGVSNSGSMAYLVALNHRDLIRGVSVVDAPLPSRSPLILNEPTRRLAAVITTSKSGPLAARMAADATRLRNVKLPVVTHKLENGGKLDQAQLLQWLDSLDRL